MTISDLIDLASLPIPDVLEGLDFEMIYAERKAALVALWPTDEQAEVRATLALESEPLARLLQENSYRELLWRQRVNDAARAVMLAYAQDADLDQRAALFDVKRLVIRPADPGHGLPEIDEDDEDLRRRIQLAPTGFSVAGPAAAYVTKALAVDGRLLDARTSRPAPGDVLVTLLSREGDGAVGQDLIDAVRQTLSAEDVRPLNDTVLVDSAAIVPYRVRALGYTRSAVGADIKIAAAQKNVAAFAAQTHRIKQRIDTSALIGVIQQAGITRTVVLEPAEDLLIGPTQAPHCIGISITYGGIDE
jgi:phage-related baseplate assembly protein